MQSIKSMLDELPCHEGDSAMRTPSPRDWSFFDKVYCISLENREDRRREALRQFSMVGLAGKVEFVLVKKHPSDSEQGIYESHMLCMANGLKSGAENILIFEDDIVFERFSRQVLKNAIYFLKNSGDWHILFFGCIMKNCKKTEHPSIAKIRYGSLTHAYVMRRNVAENLVRHHPWNRIAYDEFLKNMENASMYAVYPSFAFQSDAASDNDSTQSLDAFRRMFGGLKRIQKVNEIFHHHKVLIIGCHFLAILAIALWL